MRPSDPDWVTDSHNRSVQIRAHDVALPSTALTENVKRDIEQLKQEAEWCDKMQPSDPDWVTDWHMMRQLSMQPTRSVAALSDTGAAYMSLVHIVH